MKTKLFLFGLAALLVSFGMILIGCSGEEIIPVIESFKVMFDADSGTPAPADQMVKSGSLVTEPQIKKQGYTFGGWFMDAEFTPSNKWDFDTPVTKAMTLYAKWLTGYKVIFETNRGSPVTDQMVADGDLIDPTDVSTTRNGYTLDGWYSDAGFTTKWNFATDTVADSMILHAKFVIPMTAVGILQGSNFSISNDKGSWMNYSDHDFGYDTEKEAFYFENAKIYGGAYSFFIFEYPSSIDLSAYTDISLDMAVDNADLVNDMQWLFVRFYDDNLPSVNYENILGQASLYGINQGDNKTPAMAANPSVFYTIGGVTPSSPPSLTFSTLTNVTRIMFFIVHKEPLSGDINGKTYFKNITFIQ